jgi:transposase
MGESNLRVARTLGVTEGSVRYRLRREQAQAEDRRRNKPRKADPFAEVIDCWVRDHHPPLTESDPPGPINVRALYSHLVGECRYEGSYRSVLKFVRARYAKSKRGISRHRQSDHQWMLRVLQGKEPLDSITRAIVDEENLEALATNLHKGSLRSRNKSITVISKIRGISISTISSFLNISRETALSYWDTYRIFGHKRLFKGFRSRRLRSDDDVLIDMVFSILHTPPSAFDINRTTWKMDDLKRVLGEKGHRVSKKVIRKIVRDAGYRWKNARKVLTSNDPKYLEKVGKIQSILSALSPNERFFSIDEYGPFAVKMQGGRSLVPPGMVRTVPQRQRSKGSLILTAALELSTNQVTHFYSERKNTAEMIKLLDVLLVQYAECEKIYFSWDAASWHASRALNKQVDEINSAEYRAQHRCPLVELVPLPSCAQFLNVIESIFSGIARAIIHNSDYESLEACKAAIDRYFAERNAFFKANPKKAGRMIWGKEGIPSRFSPANNCKDSKYHFFGF